MCDMLYLAISGATQGVASLLDRATLRGGLHVVRGACMSLAELAQIASRYQTKISDAMLKAIAEAVAEYEQA